MKKVAFIFPGQGSQSIGMGKDFYENSDLAKQMIESASSRVGFDFKELLFEENDRLDQTAFTQPAILLVSAIAHKLFENEMSIKPVFSLGHSLGEFSALCSVGALDYLDGVDLVHKRGKLMAGACSDIDAGMMALIGLADDKVEQITAEAREVGKKIWAANYNSNGQIVAAGIKSDLKDMEATFKEAGAKRALLLGMSVASHCPLLDSAVAPLQESMNSLIKDEFISPVISNVTADSYSSKKEAISLLSKQLTQPVLYKQSIEKYESDVDLFIEFGGNVLKGLNKRSTKKPTLSVTDMKSLQEAFESLS
jgi:[acyl-carrier-protein] S-malonyltransferase